MPHLHLSLQAGDDLILKRMRRRHSRAQAIAACARARALRPGIALGADFIAGFPTEDEAMFQNSLDLIAETGLDYTHVFPFSARPGTPAARMPQLPGPVIHERAARLRAAAEAFTAASLARRVGTTAQIVVERGKVGHTEHYAPVRFEGEAALGRIVSVAVTGTTGDHLIGALA